METNGLKTKKSQIGLVYIVFYDFFRTLTFPTIVLALEKKYNYLCSENI
jgi:hypothetical protein